MVEYLFDPSSTTPAVLSGQTAPQTITSYFKQSSFPGPVDLAYLQFADASKTNFNLFLNNRVSAVHSIVATPLVHWVGAKIGEIRTAFSVVHLAQSDACQSVQSLRVWYQNLLCMRHVGMASKNRTWFELNVVWL